MPASPRYTCHVDVDPSLFLSFLSSKGRLLTKKISPLGNYQVDPTVEPVDLLSQPPSVYRPASWWNGLRYGFALHVLYFKLL